MKRRATTHRSTPSMLTKAGAPPVAAFILFVAALLLPEPHDPARPLKSVPVGHTAYACPADSLVSAGQVAPAESVQAWKLPDKDRLSDLESTDRWRQAEVSSTVLVDQVGAGSGAVGFFATAGGEDPLTGKAGLAVGRCPATTDESWFVGLGSGGRHESTLELTNVSDVLAVADLSAWGIDGEVEVVDGLGILLKPGQTRTVKLSKVASGEPELVVRVERRRGAFAVSAYDESHRDRAGAEISPPTLAPRRKLTIAGVPKGTGRRSLVILNPSLATSRVRVSVLGSDGPFVPQGMESVSAPAGRVTTVELPVQAGKKALSVHLESAEPIVAVVRAAADKSDYAYSVVSRPLAGPAIVGVDLNVETDPPRLNLTAEHAAASVTVSGFGARMNKLAEQKVEIAGQTTESVSLSKLTKSDKLAYVVVTPRGKVVGSATFRKGDQIASIPLEAAPVRVSGPAVRMVN